MESVYVVFVETHISPIYQVIKKLQAHILFIIAERCVRLCVFLVLLANSNSWHARYNID